MRAREFVLVTVKSIKATEMQSNKEKNIYILHTYIHINGIVVVVFAVVVVVIFTLDYKDISMNFIEPTHLKMFQGV